jgi:hypothetical protein
MHKNMHTILFFENNYFKNWACEGIYIEVNTNMRKDMKRWKWYKWKEKNTVSDKR